jgi:hypothetical protein
MAVAELAQPPWIHPGGEVAVVDRTHGDDDDGVVGVAVAVARVPTNRQVICR